MALNQKLLRIVGLLLAGLAVGLTACGKKSDPSPGTSDQAPATEVAAEPVTCVYESDTGLEFVARFQGPEAWVFLSTGTLQLKQTPAASGSRYSDGSVTLWAQGEEATLTRPNQPDIVLRNNRRRAVWEHAKLNGVDFRAVGNEPGWVLEIRGDGIVVFLGDYGQSRYEFDRPEPETDVTGKKTTYHCSSRKNEMTILLTGTACWDTMADQGYETTVLVILNGKDYRGCGRALH